MIPLPSSLRRDPVARRRLRRTGARLRPWLLPVALVLAALVVAGRPVAPVPSDAETPPDVPAGRVLVVVSPSDPAVLALAVPGTVVDVYGASPAWEAAGGVGPADLLVSAAPVMAGRPGGAGPAGPETPGGVLAAGDGASGAGAVTLAVTDAEAAALAGLQGAGLTLALRPGPSRDDQDPDAG